MSIYGSLIAKAERKGRAAAEVDEITSWLTGYTAEKLKNQNIISLYKIYGLIEE